MQLPSRGRPPVRSSPAGGSPCRERLWSRGWCPDRERLWSRGWCPDRERLWSRGWCPESGCGRGGGVQTESGCGRGGGVRTESGCGRGGGVRTESGCGRGGGVRRCLPGGSLLGAGPTAARTQHKDKQKTSGPVHMPFKQHARTLLPIHNSSYWKLRRNRGSWLLCCSVWGPGRPRSRPTERGARPGTVVRLGSPGTGRKTGR